MATLTRKTKTVAAAAKSNPGATKKGPALLAKSIGLMFTQPSGKNKKALPELLTKMVDPAAPATNKRAVGKARTQKLLANTPVDNFLDDLTLEQVTALVELGKAKGAMTDNAARVPVGTIQGLVKKGFAEKKGEGFQPTEKGRATVKKWLAAAITTKKTEEKVAAKTAKPAKAKPRTSGKVELDKKIKCLSATNPSKAGTKAAEYYDIAKKSKTVADYVKNGGSQNYLVWFIDRGKIAVS